MVKPTMIDNYASGKTVIDAGHFSAITGPSDLDVHIWEKGVDLYRNCKSSFGDVGLWLLVDDMSGVSSNRQRPALDLPRDYERILAKYGMAQDEVLLVSQASMRNRGRHLLRRKKLSRRAIPICELVSAAFTQMKEQDGYTTSLGLYDSSRTDGGLTLIGGTLKAEEIFGTSIKCYYAVYSSEDRYRLFEPRAGDAESTV